MTSLIIIFGLMTFLGGVIIVINPEIIFGVIRNNLEKLSLQVLGIGIRVAPGILLILYASESATCFITNDVDACREFYQRYFSAKPIFDAGRYVGR